MIDKDGVVERVRNFIVKECLGQDSSDELTNSTDLFESGIMDSFSALNMMSYIEKEFDIQFDSEDLDATTFVTVDSISDVIRNKVEK